MIKTKILFINASPDLDGAVAHLARDLIGGASYRSVNLVNCDVKQLGQAGRQTDDFHKICRDVARSDAIVLGTPVYCLDMSGLLKTFVDRMSELLINHGPNPFAGKDLYLVVSYTVSADAVGRIAQVIDTECQDMHIHYRGVASTSQGARRLKIK